MINPKVTLLLVVAFLVPLTSHCADTPFGIDLKELERPKTAEHPQPERGKSRKERRSAKRSEGSRHQGAAKTASDLRHTVQPAAPAAPAPSRTPIAAPPVVTWICPVPERDPAAAVDSLLNLLQAPMSREKRVEAGQGTDAAVSIEVDRYFEYKGGRYIVSIGESDAGRYTLLRVLESAGYRVLRLEGGDDSRNAADKLLRLLGVTPDFGRHRLQGGKAVTGFLIRQEGTAGKRVVLSGPAGAEEREFLAPECGAR